MHERLGDTSRASSVAAEGVVARSAVAKAQRPAGTLWRAPSSAGRVQKRRCGTRRYRLSAPKSSCTRAGRRYRRPDLRQHVWLKLGQERRILLPWTHIDPHDSAARYPQLEVCSDNRTRLVGHVATAAADGNFESSLMHGDPSSSLRPRTGRRPHAKHDQTFQHEPQPHRCPSPSTSQMESALGNQYSRLSAPMHVPGPTQDSVRSPSAEMRDPIACYKADL